MKKTLRVSDGILRLYYVAGKRVMSALNEESVIINELKDLWGVTQDGIVGTANRIFSEKKSAEK